jgi:hypothetical protein
MEGHEGGTMNVLNIPRRSRLWENTAAEMAIREAIRVVELAGCDVRLTDAVVLLGAARESVADFVDGIDNRRYVADQSPSVSPEEPHSTK